METDDPKLTAYALGELDAPEAARIEAELALDPQARQTVLEIRQCGQWLEDGLEAEPCPTLSPEQRRAVLFQEPPRVARAVPWSRFWPYWASAGIAAAACAMILAPRLLEEPAAPGNVADRSAARASNLAPTDATGVVEVVGSDALPPAGSPPSAAAQVPKTAGGRKLVPLEVELPSAVFMGTPAEAPLEDHMERPSAAPRPLFLVPDGVRNVALGKRVTGSDPAPIQGKYALVTDGEKEATPNSVLVLHRGLQWIQIDLQAMHRMYAILVWHAHDNAQAYRSMIVQVADDAEFTENVRTLFNNDYGNRVGLGHGSDKQYYESYEGRLIDAKGETGRYMRFYSDGSTLSALNRYIEVEVHALPALP